MAHHVLVVEDHVDSAEMLATFLRTLGHSTTVAHDPVTALEMIATNRPTLAIIDAGLPEMDGFALATRLRATLGPSLPIFMVSALSSAEHRERAIEHRIDVYFTKPAPLDEIEKALQMFVPH